MKTITISLGPDLECPTCGAREVKNHDAPVREWIWQIRPNKVHHNNRWWSQCLICAGDDNTKGWFAS